MHNSLTLHHAKAYLDAQLTQPATARTGHHGKVEGPYITVSRACGVGATQIATRVAEVLNRARATDTAPWTIFDQHIVEHVLQDEHLSPRLARFLPEDRMSEITGSVGEIVGLHPNLWSLVQKTNKLMRALARQGHVILVGRGGNFATAGVRGGFHVRLIAPENTRVDHIVSSRNIGIHEARGLVHKTDTARAHYVRAVFDRDVAEATAYDLVINTMKIDVAHIVELLVRLVDRRPQEATR